MPEWIEHQQQAIPAGLAELVGGHPLVVQALMRRGIVDVRQARAYLDPELYRPCDPLELPGLEQAAALVLQTLEAGKTILVWGDFDVDGQTATALLVSALRSLQGRVRYHIPVRQVESHGVSAAVLEQILDRDPSIGMVLTCDTGISAHAAGNLAQRRGVPLVITDHHTLPDRLPSAAAVINPRFLPPAHPLATLPGVGVAYMLAQELHRRGGDPAASQAYTDLAALGIVADLAELRAEARYLLQCGLRRLRNTDRLGLKFMMEAAGIEAAQLSEEHIAFMLAPRLNALGRLGDANPVVELLTSHDENRVRLVVEQIEGYNARRQLLTSQVLRAALKQVEDQPELLSEPVLVLSHPAWPAGVIGIVASRLVERYARPVVLLTAPTGEPARASARSLPGIDITAALAGCSDLLLSYGGHAMAAGFSLEAENLPALRRRLNQLVQSEVPVPVAALYLDGYLPLRELTPELVRDLERLAPFGPANPPVVLVSRELRLSGYVAVGRQQEHLQVTVEDEWGDDYHLVWWQGADFAADQQLPQGLFDLAYSARSGNLRSRQVLQVEWLAARPSRTTAAVELHQPVQLADYRRQTDPYASLLRLVEQPGVQVWAEGAQQDGLRRVVGEQASPAIRRRDQLEHGHSLVVWTAPPGQNELRQAVLRVQPKEVILFAVIPAEGSLKGFLERLAGLVKFAILQKEGRVSLAQLAAASAARLAAVTPGLRELETRGLLVILEIDEAFAHLAAGQGEQSALSSQPNADLILQLQETSAYRHFFEQSDPGLLDLDWV